MLQKPCAVPSPIGESRGDIGASQGIGPSTRHADPQNRTNAHVSLAFVSPSHFEMGYSGAVENLMGAPFIPWLGLFGVAALNS